MDKFWRVRIAVLTARLEERVDVPASAARFKRQSRRCQPARDS
jgi:hypothetical protein